MSRATWLEVQRHDGAVDARSLTPAGDLAVAEGSCPACKASPFRVRGTGVTRVDDRTLKAGGRCVDCAEAVGWIYHRPATLFGIAEDVAVLRGVPRVF